MLPPTPPFSWFSNFLSHRLLLFIVTVFLFDNTSNATKYALSFHIEVSTLYTLLGTLLLKSNLIVYSGDFLVSANREIPSISWYGWSLISNKFHVIGHLGHFQMFTIISRAIMHTDVISVCVQMYFQEKFWEWD